MPASASTDINADKLAEFFVEKVEGVRAAISNVLPSSYVRHDASPQLLSSFHWGSATSDDAFGCQKFRSRQKQWRALVEDWRVEPIGVTHPLWKISGYATEFSWNMPLVTRVTNLRSKGQRHWEWKCENSFLLFVKSGSIYVKPAKTKMYSSNTFHKRKCFALIIS